MFGKSRRIKNLEKDVSDLRYGLNQQGAALREQSQIIQRLQQELGYNIEWVPGHWELVETEDEYD